MVERPDELPEEVGNTELHDVRFDEDMLSEIVGTIFVSEPIEVEEKGKVDVVIERLVLEVQEILEAEITKSWLMRTPACSTDWQKCGSYTGLHCQGLHCWKS